MDLDCRGDVFAFDRLRYILVVDPAVPMRRDLPISGEHSRDRLGIALQGHRYAIDGDRHLARRKGAMERPESGSAAVFEQRLHVHVAHAEDRLGADPLRQKSLRSQVAVEDRFSPPSS